MVAECPEGDKQRCKLMQALVWAQAASSRQMLLPALEGGSQSLLEDLENVQVAASSNQDACRPRVVR